MVEGYTDVLALHQAGVAETVAIMGTALTEEQSPSWPAPRRGLILALDADRAGQEAMLRAARVAEERDARAAGGGDAGRDATPPSCVAEEGGGGVRERARSARCRCSSFRSGGYSPMQSSRRRQGRDRAAGPARRLIAGVPES